MEFDKIFAQVDPNGDLRLLQITDTHLFANRGAGLLGINTYDSFQAVLAQVQQDSNHFDWVVATGDLSQDHSEGSYRYFAESIQALKKPVVWLPGNHDFQQTMSETLTKASISAAKQIVSDHWQLILLDTQVPEKPHGYLSDEQLEFLDQALAEYPDKYVLILMHHQSCPIGCHWLDQHNLKNSDAFHQQIQSYPLVRAVLFGHIHQNFEYQQNGLAYIASPSTCIQFLPLSEKFALDEQQPGYRYLTLHQDGSLSTRVKRLEGHRFIPDSQSTGY